MSASPTRADLYLRSMRSWKDTAQAYEQELDELLEEHSLVTVCRGDPDYGAFESVVAQLLQKHGLALRHLVAHLRLLMDEKPPRDKKLGRGGQDVSSVEPPKEAC